MLYSAAAVSLLANESAKMTNYLLCEINYNLLTGSKNFTKEYETLTLIKDKRDPENTTDPNLSYTKGFLTTK